MIKSYCADRILCNCENCANLLVELRHIHNMRKTRRVSDFVLFCLLVYLVLELSDVELLYTLPMTVSSISSTTCAQRICTSFAAFSSPVQSRGV